MSEKRVDNGLTKQLQHVIEDGKLLDIQEKISLVFLMCDDARSAYDFSKEEPKKILPDLISYLDRVEKSSKDDKFLESLICIKNYKVLKLSGYTDKEIEHLKARYNGFDNKQYINSVRKALLSMCENMNVNELTILMQKVESDIIKTGSSFNKSNFMEINLLFLIIQDYISDGTNGKESNVIKLIEHLHEMNELKLAKELEKVNNTHFSDNEQNDENIISPDNDFVEKSYSLNIGKKSVAPLDEDRYDMDKENMGLCVIINQRDFCEEECQKNGNVKIGTRYGTNFDRDMITITFTGLGFQVKLLENLDRCKLLVSVQDIIEKDVLQKHSSFVLCILSHGKRDEVYCVDGMCIPVEDIEKMILSEDKLLGKPKIIFIQACQGNEWQKARPCLPHHDGEDEDDCNMPECDGATNSVDSSKVAPTADLLTFWATVPGYASFRYHKSGSVFIQTLCDLLLKHGHENHLEDIVRNVNDRLCKTRFGDEDHVAVPIVRHTNTKKLHFPHCPYNRYKSAEMLFLKYLFEHLIQEFVINIAALQCFAKKKRKQGISED